MCTQFTKCCVRSYIPRVTSSWINVGHASQYRNKLRHSAADIEKMYQKGAPSESEVIEA